MKKAFSQLAIYVSSYAIYNDGRLDGQWYTVSDYSSYDELLTAIKSNLAEHGDFDPEIMVQDVEYDVLDLYSEAGLSWVEEYFSEKFDKIDDVHMPAFLAFVDSGIPDGIDDALNTFEFSYCSAAESEEDYAREFIKEVYDIPDALMDYIDFDKYASDLFADLTYYDGYVFK